MRVYIQSFLFSCVLFSFLFLASCKKEVESPGSSNNNQGGGTNTDQTGNENVFVLEGNQWMATGVPVVDDSNKVYMAFVDDVLLDANATIVCLDANNKLKWKQEINEPVNQLVMLDELLVFVSLNYLHAYQASDGAFAWRVQITDPSGMANTKMNYKPCIDHAGNIIVAMDSYLQDLSTAVQARVISVSPQGNINWDYHFESEDNYYDRFTKLSEPLATAEYLYFSVYISSSYGDGISVFAMDATGAVVSDISLGDYHYNSSFVAVNDQGYPYFALRNADLYATELLLLHPDLSEEEWRFDLPDYVANKAVVDVGGNLYIGCEDGFLYKVSSAGLQIWKVNIGKIFVRGELLIANDNNLYRCNQTPERMDMLTGEFESIVFSEGMATTDPAMRSDGVLVLGAHNKIVFIDTKSGGLDENAPWPKYGKDNKNTSLSN